VLDLHRPDICSRPSLAVLLTSTSVPGPPSSRGAHAGGSSSRTLPGLWPRPTPLIPRQAPSPEPARTPPRSSRGRGLPLEPTVASISRFHPGLRVRTMITPPPRATALVLRAVLIWLIFLRSSIQPSRAAPPARSKGRPDALAGPALLYLSEHVGRTGRRRSLAVGRRPASAVSKITAAASRESRGCSVRSGLGQLDAGGVHVGLERLRSAPSPDHLVLDTPWRRPVSPSAAGPLACFGRPPVAGQTWFLSRRPGFFFFFLLVFLFFFFFFFVVCFFLFFCFFSFCFFLFFFCCCVVGGWGGCVG